MKFRSGRDDVSPDWWFWLLFGIFLGGVFVAALASGPTDSIRALGNNLDNFANRYQQLLAGLAAVLAASIAVRPVWQQVRIQQRQAAPRIIANSTKTLRELTQLERISQRIISSRVDLWGIHAVYSETTDVKYGISAMDDFVNVSNSIFSIAEELDNEVKQNFIASGIVEEIKTLVAELRAFGRGANQSSKEALIASHQWKKQAPAADDVANAVKKLAAVAETLDSGLMKVSAKFLDAIDRERGVLLHDLRVLERSMRNVN